MANENEKLAEEEEPKIPVFTVLKNGAVLKNIFIVNKPPPPQTAAAAEEILIVGRHPDCNIVLTHPSVSRFHLQILSDPSSHKLSVTDLSSVHGTWVSEKRIEPGVAVELRQGDTLRVGASTRLYRLHWIPLSHAYQFSQPLQHQAVNCLLPETAEPEFSDVSFECSVENMWSIGNQEIPSEPQGVDSSSEDGCQDNEMYGTVDIDQGVSLTENAEFDSAELNLGYIEKKEILSAPSVPYEGDQSELGDDQSSKHDNQEYQMSSFWAFGTESVNLFYPLEGSTSTSKEDQYLQINCDTVDSELEDNPEGLCLNAKEVDACPTVQVPLETESQSQIEKDEGQTDNFCLVKENSSLLSGEVLGAFEDKQVDDENLNSETKSLLSMEVVEEAKTEQLKEKDFTPAQESTILVNLDVERYNDIRGLLDEQDEILSEMIDDKDSQTPPSICTTGKPESEFCESPPLRVENNSVFGESISARRGKPASVFQILTDRSRGKATMEARNYNDNGHEVESFTPDKENLTPHTLQLRSLTKNKVEINLDDEGQQDEEIFTPDKENFTPNTLRLRFLKKGTVIVDHPKSHMSSSPSNKCPEDLLVGSEKEKQTLKNVQERKSVETTTGNQAGPEKKLTPAKLSLERMPFQSLPKTSACKNRSEASEPNVTCSGTSLTCSRTMGKLNNLLSNKSVREGERGWTVVADITTLLDKESRKALQFLQGLKGTHLIIPRMVIWELDCLKQHGSLFRKKSEASLVLEWIEECMVKTKWWIHVQRSVEDGRMIAQTPPASPQSLISEKNWGFTFGTTRSIPFTRCRSSMELVSPAAEDHILDCALSHRNMCSEGQLALLSNDITLKIKAMAEGLICETAQEFHWSLVNPFSKRFMWAGSCPRGRTWSFLADVVLAEKYNCCALKKSSKGGGAQGLKLILLHNSQYGQIH